jgi:hypothetical protein
MLVTLRGRGYVRHIATLHCSWLMMLLCSSHCDERDMLITLQRHGYVHHIVTTWIFSSHGDDMAMLSHCNVALFVRLRRYYVHDIVTILYIRHIATLLCLSHCNMWLCSSNCNIVFC